MGRAEERVQRNDLEKAGGTSQGIWREPSVRTSWRGACQQRAAWAKALGDAWQVEEQQRARAAGALEGAEISSSCHRALGALGHLGTKCSEDASVFWANDDIQTGLEGQTGLCVKTSFGATRVEAGRPVRRMLDSSGRW